MVKKSAANTVVFPLTVAALAIAVMIGDGGCAFVSISLTREIIFGVGFAILLPRFLGLDGLLYSFPASDILTFLIAMVVIMQTYKDLSRNC